ncbi:Uncharacterised protein [Mycobacterium tuberculosis]|nr:Uncharacterised protein [Mycobacterium tuberculosis]
MRSWRCAATITHWPVARSNRSREGAGSRSGSGRRSDTGAGTCPGSEKNSRSRPSARVHRVGAVTTQNPTGSASSSCRPRSFAMNTDASSPPGGGVALIGSARDPLWCRR